MKQKKGFTLLEILLVIAVIGILATIVIAAINPTRQLAQARNAQRRSHLKALNDAIHQYTIDVRSYPAGLTAWYKDICPSGGGVYCVDLSGLAPTYIANIPRDPDGVNQYKIALDPLTNSVSLKSGGSEQNINIAINPLSNTTTFAKKAGGTGVDRAYKVATYSDGSSISTGYFWGTATFGQGEANQTLLTSSGGYDIFIAKYNSNGTLAWAKRAGGTSWEYGFGIRGLADGGSIITGSFGETVVFGQGEPNQTTLISTGSNWTQTNIFIAKYNADGTLAWAKRAGGTLASEGYSVETLSDGSSLLTGMYSGSTTFGPGESNQTVLTNSGLRDVFLAKYNANGTLAWVKKAGGSGWDFGYDVKVNSIDQTSIVTGVFEGTATFGQGEANQTLLTSSGTFDVFLAKYNANGTLAWVKKAGGSSADYASGIVSYADNSYGLIGYFQGTATFGQGEANQTLLTSSGSSDIFIARYNADGTLIWAKRAGGVGSDYSYGMDSLSDGSSLITGTFDSLAIFGAGESNQSTVTSSGAEDIYIAKYHSNGNLIWVKRAGGIDTDFSSSITSYSNGSSVITGYFQGTATFGQGELNQTILNSSNDDIFITKYNSDGKLE